MNVLGNLGQLATSQKCPGRQRNRHVTLVRMQPLISPRWTALLTVVVILMLRTKQAFASGGGEITTTHDEIQVTFATSRKIPMRGDEARYAKSIDEWEKVTAPIAATVTTAIESSVLVAYRGKLNLVSNSFASNSLSRLSSEGVVPSGDNATGPFLLTVPLDMFPGQYIQANAMFVVQTRPSKAVVREFARAVQTAAVATDGRKLPLPRQLMAYWVTPPSKNATSARPALLLLDVPVLALPDALQQAPWHEMGYETFRSAHALLLETYRKKFITPNQAEFLIANVTAAKFDAAKKLISLQVNGNYLPAMKIHKATRAQAIALLTTPLDPSLAPSVTAAARDRWQDDLDFLDSLKVEIAK